MVPAFWYGFSAPISSMYVMGITPPSKVDGGESRRCSGGKFPPTVRPLQSANRVMTFLGNSSLYLTVFAWNRDTAVPEEGTGDLRPVYSDATQLNSTSS